MDAAKKWYRGSPTSTVSTSTISTSTNFIAIGIKLVLVEFLWNCYVVKIVLVEIGYVELTSANFAYYDFFKIPKIVLREDPLYCQYGSTAKHTFVIMSPLSVLIGLQWLTRTSLVILVQDETRVEKGTESYYKRKCKFCP